MSERKLTTAKLNKKDEFYTRLVDIENEVKNYKSQFKNKVVLLPCDDPELIKDLALTQKDEEDKASQFWVYFHKNFKKFGLKKLIATHYSKTASSYMIEYDGQGDDLNIFDFDRVELKGNGDFRSDEVKELYKLADVIVTNPPFSLFREFVAQLIEFKKEFIIIGHQNAITYKEVFKLIKENKIWLGYGFKGGAGYFVAPHYEDHATASSRIEGLIRVSGVNWFTNMPTKKRNEILELFTQYDPETHMKYDNYDAINVKTCKEIPVNYQGEMGVPITFLDKFNPNQFEIIGLGSSQNGKDMGVGKWDRVYSDYRKKLRDGTLYYVVKGVPQVPYARVVIKRKVVNNGN